MTLADDWKVEEKQITITRAQLNAALSDCVTLGLGQWHVDEIARRLGL